MSDARVAVVTGANRGIGLAIAHGLTQQGLRVAVAARHLDDATAAAADIGGAAFPVQLDVTDAASVTSAVQRVLDVAGGLHVVVNNAGGHYDDGADARTLTDDDLTDAFEVNTIGPMRVIRAAVPHLLAQGWGRIVNVSSRSGTFSATWGTAPAYGVSKAALNMLTLQLAKDLDGTGVLVNACCPGWVRTRMGGDDAERSVEEGADTPIWLATLPDAGPSGLLFGDRSVIDW
ncbi:MAG: SDR family NAD(P)-dependent oxidoreductase [Actinobacteria bacterium]|nr:SDR family NAD(P)-dependent oxidoreductase [Actinomycetota bacterium]